MHLAVRARASARDEHILEGDGDQGAIGNAVGLAVLVPQGLVVFLVKPLVFRLVGVLHVDVHGITVSADLVGEHGAADEILHGEHIVAHGAAGLSDAEQGGGGVKPNVFVAGNIAMVVFLLLILIRLIALMIISIWIIQANTLIVIIHLVLL